MADLIHPLLEISKKRDVRSVTAGIDQYIKRLNELINMNKLPVPHDETHQRQIVRVQEYRKNSLKSVGLNNKLIKKINYFGFLKGVIEITPPKVSRTSKVNFATVITPKNIPPPQLTLNSAYSRRASKKKTSKDDVAESDDGNYGPEIVPMSGGNTISPRHHSNVDGEKPSFFLDNTQNESRRSKRKGSDKRLKALLSIRNNSASNMTSRSEADNQRDYKHQENIHNEVENYIQKQVELEELPKELLSKDQNKNLFKGYYARINQQNEANRLKARLVEFVSKL